MVPPIAPAAASSSSNSSYSRRIARIGAILAALGLAGGYLWRSDACEARLQEPSLLEALTEQGQPLSSAIASASLGTPSDGLKLLLQELPSGVVFVEGSSDNAASDFVRATLATRPSVVYLSLDVHLAHSPEALVRYLASSLGVYLVSSYCLVRDLLGAPMTTKEDTDYWTRAVVAVLTEALRAIRARDGKHFYPPTILVSNLNRFLEEALAQGRLNSAGENLIMQVIVSFLSALEALASQGLVHVVVPQAAGEALRRSSAPGFLDAAGAHSRGKGRVSPASGAAVDEATGPKVFTLRSLQVEEVESFLWAQIFHPKSFDADIWRHRNVEELRNIKFSVAYETFKVSRSADFAAIVAISELLVGNQSLIDKYVATVRTMAAERLVAASLTLDPRYGAVADPSSPSSTTSDAKMATPTDIMDYINPDVLRKAFCRLVDYQGQNTARAMMEMLSRPNEVSLVPSIRRPAVPAALPGHEPAPKVEEGAATHSEADKTPSSGTEECSLEDQQRFSSTTTVSSPTSQYKMEDDIVSQDTDAYDKLFDRSRQLRASSVSSSDIDSPVERSTHQYAASPSSNSNGQVVRVMDSLLRKLYAQRTEEEVVAATETQKKSVIRDSYNQWSRSIARGAETTKLVDTGSEETDTSMYDNENSAGNAAIAEHILKPLEDRLSHAAPIAEGPTRSWRLQLKYLLRALIDMSMHSASSTTHAPSSNAAANLNSSSVRVPIWQFVAEYLHGDPELLWFMIDNRLIRLTASQSPHERSEEEGSARDVNRAHIQGFSFPLDSAQHVYQVEFYSPMVRRAVEILLLDGTNYLQDVMTAKAPAASNHRTHHRPTQSSRDHRAAKTLKGSSAVSSPYQQRGINVVGYEGRGNGNKSEASSVRNHRAFVAYSARKSTAPFSSMDRVYLASCDAKLQRLASCDLQFLDDMEVGLVRGAGQLLGVCGDGGSGMGRISALTHASMVHSSASTAADDAEICKLAEKRLIQASVIHGGGCEAFI